MLNCAADSPDQAAYDNQGDQEEKAGAEAVFGEADHRLNASAKMDSNQSTTPIKAITPIVATLAQTIIPIVTAWFILLPRSSSIIAQGSPALGELDDVLRDCALGCASDLELDLDRAQDFTRLSGDGIGPVRQDVLVLQVGQRLPKDVLQATSRERPDYLDRCVASCDRVLRFALAVCDVALCSLRRFGI